MTASTTLQPHQQRVVDERTELHTRLMALERFKTTSTYNALPLAERRRLLRQSRVMVLYVDVLDERIEAFTP